MSGKMENTMENPLENTKVNFAENTIENKSENVILASIGEIALKGLNRGKFEQRLIKNLAFRLSEYGSFKIAQRQSRIWVESNNQNIDWQGALDVCSKVFGIVSCSLVKKYSLNGSSLIRSAHNYIETELSSLLLKKPYGAEKLKFKVEAKRSDKAYPLTSIEIATKIGGYLLDKFHFLAVDVHEPDFILYVEIRDALYIYSQKIEGLRGLPVGMSGKSMLLLSGGIDSPVAGFMLASRGVEIEAVYFHTPPYTSDRAKQKVIDLAEKLSLYTGKINLHIVDFTDEQLQINKNCPQDLLTVIMRRMMMRVAEKLAYQRSCISLCTGESLGQVASQTMQAINTTNSVVSCPVFRPLIALDKEETIKIARKIGTFKISIQPYEDCCTVFVAKHPKTKPNMAEVLKAESKLNIAEMITSCLKKIEVHTIELSN